MMLLPSAAAASVDAAVAAAAAASALRIGLCCRQTTRWQALPQYTLVYPLFRITTDATQTLQIDYRLHSDCLEHLKYRLCI
jgi:hypothetical protein